MDERTALRPAELILRCYVRRSGRSPERWVAHCIDLDLWASAGTMEDAEKSLSDAIVGYVQTVLDTTDVESVPRLLRRRAPLRYIALWHAVRLASRVMHDGTPPLDTRPFRRLMPLKLAVAA